MANNGTLPKKEEVREEPSVEKVTHKNYLIELRNSNILKRQNEFQTILEDKKLERIQDRFDLVKFSLSKNEKRIAMLEQRTKTNTAELPAQTQTSKEFDPDIKLRIIFSNFLE